MKHSLLAVLLVLCATAASGEDSLQEKIDDALLPMPSILRDGAEVFSYNSSWNRTVLRQGTNSIRCVAPGSSTLAPTVVAQCFHESWESPFLRISQLQAEGMALEKVFNILLEEIDEGKVAGPDAGSSGLRNTQGRGGGWCGCPPEHGRVDAGRNRGVNRAVHGTRRLSAVAYACRHADGSRHDPGQIKSR